MKRVFRKQSLVEAPIQSDAAAAVGLLGVCRQQVNAPVSMLGFALSVGATASVVSMPGMALAAEGSTIIVLPAAGNTVQEPTAAAPLGTSFTASADYYTVNEGDTLWHIAARHQADVDTIKSVNGISPSDVLREGQVLRVPTDNQANTGSALGAVGGEDLSMSEDQASLARLSVDELEQGWVSLEGETTEFSETEADKLDEEALSELSEESEQSEAIGSTSLAMASGSNDWVEATTTETQAAQPNVAPPELQPSPDIAVAPLTETATTSSSWQDAAVDVALATPSAESDLAEPTDKPEVAESTAERIAVNPNATAAPTGTTPALPMSMALHEEDQLTPRLSVRRPAQPVATAPQAEVATSQPDKPADQTETVAAGDRLAPSTQEMTSPRTREQVIQDHLARIRESNGSMVDRDLLNERIRLARLALEQNRTEAALPETSTSQTRVTTASRVSQPVTQSSALLARESTFVAEGSEAEAPSSAAVAEPNASTTAPVLPNLPPRLAAATAGNEVDPNPAVAEQQDWTITDVATESEALPTQVAAAPRIMLPNLPAPTSVAPEATTPEATTPNGQQMLAAAPMGADAYRPFPSVETGQTVSPGMPMLPGSDSFLPSAPNRFNGYIWPTHGTFTSGYGWRWGRMHRGIDVAGPVGTPIVAAASGVVVRSGWNSGGYGNLVDIRHPDGSLTRYAHNSRLLVREGQQINQGQQIAEMGSTGRSTGPHLHFEIHLPGTGTVNPMAHLPRR